MLLLFLLALPLAAASNAASDTFAYKAPAYDWPADLPDRFNWCDNGGCGISRGQCGGGCQRFSWYANIETQYWLSQGRKKLRSVSGAAYEHCEGNTGYGGLSFGAFDKQHGIFFEETHPWQGLCRTCGPFFGEYLPLMQAKLQEQNPSMNFTEDPCLVKKFLWKYKVSKAEVPKIKKKVQMIDEYQQAGWGVDNNSTVHSQYGTYADCKKNYKPDFCRCPLNLDSPVKPDVPPGTFQGMYEVPIAGNITKMARLIKQWGPARTNIDGAQSNNIDINHKARNCGKSANHEVIIVGWDRTPEHGTMWILRNSMRPNNDVYGLTYIGMDCNCKGYNSCGHMSGMHSKTKVLVFSDPNRSKGDARGTFKSLEEDFGATFIPQKHEDPGSRLQAWV